LLQLGIEEFAELQQLKDVRNEEEGGLVVSQPGSGAQTFSVRGSLMWEAERKCVVPPTRFGPALHEVMRAAHRPGVPRPTLMQRRLSLL